MKRKIILLAILASALKGEAQLGYTLEELAQKYSDNYSVGYTKDSLFFAVFEDIKSNFSDRKTVLITFFNSDKKDGVCFKKTVIHPIEELNLVITKLNEKYVRESDLEWTDYEKGLKYNINIFREDEIFLLYTFFYK